MTIGILIGIYAAPWVGSQGFDFGQGSKAASPLNGLTESASDAAIRPSDETAKGELFRLSNLGYLNARGWIDGCREAMY